MSQEAVSLTGVSPSTGVSPPSFLLASSNHCVCPKKSNASLDSVHLQRGKLWVIKVLEK